MVTDLWLDGISLQEYEFVRLLRTDARTKHNFIQQGDITEEKQKEYMSIHGKDYYICFYHSMPVGFIGVINNDVRFCVVPYYNNRGIGTFMLKEIKLLYPNATGKIKSINYSSMRAFENANIPYTIIYDNQINQA